ncbi:DUF3310 domain-containing protein [Staphylococcus lloydii]|uniref:DUF3310 domain-containing protein n=1 Tax=Staphylococcus lloydii TaxID=2781774 RepID=UPI002928855E|nr:DUF3310 domain-containing protein [Staphylococcus lloydii]MDU9418078.1 DUF3310 domain-containing protein [Staphylococcus lloydii]
MNINYLSYLSNGRWIEFVNKIGQSELGRFESIVRTIHDYKIKGKVIKFNGDIAYIDENTDWIPVSYEKQEELESMYTNDLQQRKRNDNVNHPAHYTQGKVEVIEFIEQVTKDYNANVAYHIGNAIKYLARSPHKNGKEDIAKAKWYIERAFEQWEG